ncbi:MAG: DUF1579 domain-containing protein [bacterium]|nr:DUF1579 domain-containing protein [bacterium]
MFAARFAAVTAATLLSGVAIAAIASVNPFQGESPAVDQHKVVMQAVGNWEGTLTMNVPGMPEPMVMSCTETITGVGDLWTVSRFESNYMGTEFVRSSTFGYDTEKKAFVSTWVDSMSTTITNMEGQYDEATSSVTSNYQAKDSATGKMVDKRSVCTWDTDSYVCKFYDVAEEETLMMTIEMKRKKTIEANAEAK